MSFYISNTEQDLVVGAKDARLFIGGELLWEGTIDKVGIDT